MIDDMEAKWAEFEVLGEEKVAQMLAQGVWNATGIKAAEGWLAFKTNVANMLSNSEANAIARATSFSVAAQAKTARLALIISIIAIAISIISLFKN